MLLGKTVTLKTCRKSKFFEERKGARYIRGNVYFGIIVFSYLSSTNTCLRFLLICFAREIKGFYQSSLGNKADFRDKMKVSQKYLGLKLKFHKKLRHGCVDERALITTLMSSCHWKDVAPFCLPKKRPENAFLTLMVKYHKNRRKI